MDKLLNHINEHQAAAAFSKQAAVFDDLYGSDSIIKYKRTRVRNNILKLIKPGASILELNAGTGDDAIFFAEQGYLVHATDVADGMQRQLEGKVKAYQLNALVTNELCSYTSLSNLVNRGPYDCIFSNFAGLNCTGDLQHVLQSFDSLLKPGGIVILVVLPGFCLWESLLVFRGKFKTATRRFFSSNGRKARVEGTIFNCWYYSPEFIKNALGKTYTEIETEGLCTIVPPSYIEHFAERYPKAFLHLCNLEDRFKNKWPWKKIGDYFIISLRKR